MKGACEDCKNMQLSIKDYCCFKCWVELSGLKVKINKDGIQEVDLDEQ